MPPSCGSRPRWRRQPGIPGRGEPSGRAAGVTVESTTRSWAPSGCPTNTSRTDSSSAPTRMRRLLRPGRSLAGRRLSHRLHREADPGRRHGNSSPTACCWHGSRGDTCRRSMPCAGRQAASGSPSCPSTSHARAQYQPGGAEADQCYPRYLCATAWPLLPALTQRPMRSAGERCRWAPSRCSPQREANLQIRLQGSCASGCRPASSTRTEESTSPGL